MGAAPPRRLTAPPPASSVAHVLTEYAGSLRPCLAAPEPRRSLANVSRRTTSARLRANRHRHALDHVVRVALQVPAHFRRLRVPGVVGGARAEQVATRLRCLPV